MKLQSRLGSPTSQLSLSGAPGQQTTLSKNKNKTKQNKAEQHLRSENQGHLFRRKWYCHSGILSYKTETPRFLSCLVGFGEASDHVGDTH